MTLPVFLLIDAKPNPDEKEALQTYLSQAPTIIKEHGGVPVATYDVDQPLGETNQSAIFGVISFPSSEAIHNLFLDPDYQAIVPVRERGFSRIHFYIVNERI